MSKKLINSILLLCVLVLWGILGYKFIYGNKPTETAVVFDPENESIRLPISFKKDTFDLKPRLRDPFLGKVVSRTTPKVDPENKSTVVKPAPIVSAPKMVYWPKIEYLGYLKKDKDVAPLLLIKVDDKLYRKKSKDQIIEGLQVVKFYADSIRVKFNGLEKTIRK